MNVSYKWLKDLVEIPCSIEEYEKSMVLAGFEVEGITKLINNVDGVVVGRITKIDKHPDADKLQICMVNVGQDEDIQIITAADNVFEGAVIPVALVGAKLPDGTAIKKGKLRGIESFGMMCGGSELGFDKMNIKNAEVDGILILEGDYTLGQDIVSALGLDDDIVEFSITSNRSDCMSMNGLAMESAAVLNTTCNVRHSEPVKGSGTCALKVEVEAKDICPRYMAAVVEDIVIEPSPDWMQKRLIASGIRPINNIVDITNYVMTEYGQPMHAFDYSCVHGEQIIVTRARQDYKVMNTLDGKERQLKEDMLLICDDSKPIGIAGVMGGENSQITGDTKRVVFESALFDSKSIRHTSKALGMATESSAKYSKGISPMNPYYALNRALELVQQLKCGKVVSNDIDIVSCDLTEKTVTVNADKINSRISMNLSPEEMKGLLERLNIKTDVKGNELVCTIPYYRLDIDQMADIAEEVIRIYGYHHVPVKALPKAGMGCYNENQYRLKKLRELFVGKGYNEVVTYSFTSSACFDKLKFDDNDYRRQVVKIKNPLGEDQSVMRTVMADSMLNVLSLNKRKNTDAMTAYEIGRVYLPKAGQVLPDERQRLSIGMYGEDVDFYDIKGAVESVLELFGIKDYDVYAQGSNFLHPGRRCVIKVGDTFIAEIGEVAPDVLEAYDISVRAYVADVDIQGIYDHETLEKKYVPIPRFPAVYRDLAVTVETNVPVGNMVKHIEKNKYITQARIFDVYQGKQVEEGSKSVAFSLVFRAADRTLSDKEINTQFDKIVKSLGEEFGASLRL